LLPIIILYYCRNEQKIGKRILNCFKYGMIFILIMIFEYIPYIKDINVLLSMMPQLDKYSKSIYSALIGVNVNLMTILRSINITVFIYYFICSCIEFLLNKKNTLIDMLRKYNVIMVLSLSILTTCQQWYLGWLFATIMWQKSSVIKDIIGLTAIVELANSIYMFKSESYIYDIYFVLIIVCLFILWQVITRRKNNKLEGQR